MASPTHRSPALSGGRVLIAELDSQAQARAFPPATDHGRFEGGVRDAIEALTEKLRVGVAVAETVLVTDAMVLDGRYFLTLGPDGLLRELGASTAHLPMVVTGIDESLAAALSRRRSTQDHRWAIADGLPSGRWLPPVHVERSWAAWIHAADSGIVRYERQGPADAPFRFGDVGELSAPGLAMVEALRAERRRSDVEHLLDSTSGLTRADLRALRDWWGDAYLRLIAENAKASWISFAGSRASGLEERAGSVTMRLPHALVTWARTCTPAEFAGGRRATTALRRNLQTGPSGLRLRGLAYVAAADVTRPSRTRVVLEGLARIAVALCLIFIALPFVPFLAADGPFAWAVFAVVAVGTFPLAAFMAVFSVLRPERTAVLIVHPVGSEQ